MHACAPSICTRQIGFAPHDRVSHPSGAVCLLSDRDDIAIAATQMKCTAHRSSGERDSTTRAIPRNSRLEQVPRDAGGSSGAQGGGGRLQSPWVNSNCTEGPGILLACRPTASVFPERRERVDRTLAHPTIGSGDAARSGLRQRSISSRHPPSHIHLLHLPLPLTTPASDQPGILFALRATAIAFLTFSFSLRQTPRIAASWEVTSNLHAGVTAGGRPHTSDSVHPVQSIAAPPSSSLSFLPAARASGSDILEIFTPSHRSAQLAGCAIEQSWAVLI